ncbi:MAG TPA: hypothetical protein VIF40_10615 [Methylosinus sp.]|uniref:hypothetical protein n=1 Tax=Methylosinus sp. TaxID=427 RepID=UPI002F91D07C
MHARFFVSLAVCLGLSSSEAFAGEDVFYEPQQGSTERAAILDALRPSAEAAFGKPIEFRVLWLRVAKGHALLRAHPQRPGGKPIKLWESCEQSAEELELEALMRRTDEKWRIVLPTNGRPNICGDDVTVTDSALKERGLPPQLAGHDKYLAE